ncbi:MAG: Ig-like domain-containing protein, partial [Pseudomonadota bacterium]
MGLKPKRNCTLLRKIGGQALALATIGLASGALYAAKPVPLTCAITASDPIPVEAGGSVGFQGVINGGSAPYEVTWTFDGGTPSPTSGLGPHTITYNDAGSYTATMAATDSHKKTKSCEATVAVDVTVPGNNPPVAQNDDYNTPQDTPLDVAAPGVLFNDNDPNGDPMSAILVADVSNGTLTLNGDGSFSYSPAAGFSGQDSFTYVVEDGNGPSSNV